ncbi:MAG: hypothetical protein DRO04_02640 [Candidatus Iainarchaeum archaeon]|uniref:Uncharacterized protein n=1 Tax=Candidatus Iainarchaeum sp. TaxID=3101447 RepID=A0A497JJ93_9ARCH|nr:MAG: hypothetical protein DRO04_02640 [Candidatus Diapherotrites archaeon]
MSRIRIEIRNKVEGAERTKIYPHAKVRVKKNEWVVEIFEDGKRIGKAEIGGSEASVQKLIEKLILAYNPLPPKPPSLLAEEAIQHGSVEFPSPLAKEEA